jgi:hypothetical protein
VISQFSLPIPRSFAAGSSGVLPLRGRGREGVRERGDGQGLLLNFFDPARSKDQEFVLVIFNFYIFCPFLFSFLEGWEFSHPGDPKKKNE